MGGRVTITYPTKGEVQKIIDSKVPTGRGYVIVFKRVYINIYIYINDILQKKISIVSCDISFHFVYM